MDFGDWASDSDDSGDPYLQLLSLTDPKVAYNTFVTERLGGVDTTGEQKYALLPVDQMQKSPVSDEEKKKKYQEMILSRWPYILVGCLVGLILIIGLIIWRCCCRRNKKPKQNEGLFGEHGPSESYLQLRPSQSQATLIDHSQPPPYKGYSEHHS